MTRFSTFDILAVAVIGIIAVLFLARVFIKMRKNKCATMCNGCNGGSCSTRVFGASDQIKGSVVKIIRQF